MDVPFDSTDTDDRLAETRAREQEDVASILAQKYGMTYADLSMREIDPDALRLIPEEKARAAEVAAFAKAANRISLAVHNPNNQNYQDVLKELTEHGLSFEQFLVSEKSLERAFDQYKELSLSSVSKIGVVSVINSTLEKLSGGANKNALQEEIKKVAASDSFNRISQLLETVLAGAFALRASDIHFEPRENDALLRFRIDGQLADIFMFDSQTYARLLSRVKLLSGVKLNVSDRAQDGRFSIAKSDEEIEMRSSFIPGNFGESVVMRILDPKATQVSYKDLGINAKLLVRLEEEIRRPNGMLLTTGPTGSGKTTTLYSFLRELYAPEKKIITIEDPVEYHLEGIVQTQVEGEKYTFAEGLRSIVRQDPDIIMVGEIRDAETADIAIQAALTGHFVLSTLHTNDAAGTFPRLVDLGADPKSFGSAVTVSMAQRLVRRLEPERRQERALTAEEKTMIAKAFEGFSDQSLIPQNPETVWEPVTTGGDDTGYRGRVGLYEAIFMDDELSSFLRDNPPSNEIAKAAAKQGYLTMAQDGILKALAGTTTLSEVAATVNLPRA